jgi:hypothetical protein
VEQNVVVESTSGAAPLRLDVHQQPECLPVFRPDFDYFTIKVRAAQAGCRKLCIARAGLEQRMGGAF